MRNLFSRLFFVLVVLALIGLPVFGQATSTGSLAGTVTDPKGAVLAGATVTLANDETKQEFTAVTSGEGTFTIPSLFAGLYTATISQQGFKTAKVTEIKIDVGKPSSIQVALEVGAATETVTIVGGGELLQTQTATVGTTLSGRQITDIPTASRNALDLVLALPGTGTPGRPRTSSVNGLPKGAINITLDGVNVQDNTLKSSDGFFTFIQPRTDAIQEVTVSTSTPGAESSAEGSVQVKFVTQAGGNEYHGGGYWYHRNPALNANYWFNNRDLAPDPVTHKAPQQRIILNQFGVKVGGPISVPKLFDGKDKLFFFANYEEYRLPEKSVQRVRTIYTTDAANGLYKFNTTLQNCPPGVTTGCFTPPTNVTCTTATNRLCTADLLAMATAGGITNTLDPTIKALLAQIQSSVGTVNGVLTSVASNPNLQQFGFFNTGGQTRRFPTVRLDANLGKNHHLENISNYQQFDSVVDFLNNVDPVFPGFPNHGSQTSNRFSNTSAWRWTITPNITNEARFGLTGGTTKFFGEVTPEQFSNQGFASLNINSPGFGVNTATATRAPELRNAPVKQFQDNLSWVHGKHAFNLGASFTRLNLWITDSNVVPTVNFGVSSSLEATSPAFTAFAGLAPGVNQQANAANMWATLVGRIASLGRQVALSETSGNYVPQGFFTSRGQQTEYGIFGQDSWRIKPNLTLNYGLRWEVQGPFSSLNNTLTQTGYAGLYGESGIGNLFKPGTLTGSPTTYTRFAAGDETYKTQYGNFAPSFGFAWQPHFGSGLLHRLAGEAGETVVRGGFSTAFVREGINTFLSIQAANPGQTIDASQNITGTPFALPFGLLFRNGIPATAPGVPTQPNLPSTGFITDAANSFNPNLKTGYVESWTIGIQREIKKDNVIEVRYVGNRGHQLWRQVDLNELNVFENGAANEFKLAQANVLANLANGRGFTMKYFGPGTNTSPLPILFKNIQAPTQVISGATVNSDVNNAAHYSSSLWANTTILSPLNPLNPSLGAGRCCGGFWGIFAGTANESLFAPNRAAWGVPVNFFVVNPGKRGGAFEINNNAQSWYDAVTLEFRRRLSRGLLVQSNYTFGKALSNEYASSSVVFDQPATLRDYHLRKGFSPFDITQGFKTNFIYELPFGRGKQFLGSTKGIVNGFLGDWVFNGNIRIQSGSPFSFGNVQLVGMTQKDLQKAIGVYRGQANSDNSAATGQVYFLPLDIRLNTFRANNVSFTSAGAVYTQGAPSGRFIAPAGFGNCQQGIVGGCGFNNLVLKGPAFFRFDLSLAKKIKFTERMNLEMRAEALNAFNNINWLVGAAGNDVNAPGGLTSGLFGRYTAAYQDISTTNDPGGRLVQLVLRLNF
ncbi:MAG TPA: carboxypeptidase-like regulatory domain-containing protein [Pyrinomonadaceae bacterium]|nr:carboxypeptidase-like regulatory domain-containing protein [Pyrinomonadaceae bacterium]